MATTMLPVRLQCRDSKRLLELRRAMAAATADKPVPQAVLDALVMRLDTAIVQRPVAHDSGHPYFFVIELDLADWLADLLATEWPAALVQDGEG